MGRVFVFGAGFSVHAGFPLVRSLREEVIDFMCQNPDASYDVHLHPHPSFPKGQFWQGLEAADANGKLEFEELLILLLQIAANDRWHPAGITEKILRHACGRLIWSRQNQLPKLPDAYIRFARQLQPKDVIVSFNWDMLIERACEETHKPWSYEPYPVVRILKPHGSVNWSTHRQFGGRVEGNYWQPIFPNATLDYYIEPLGDPFPNGVQSDFLFMLFPGDPEDPSLIVNNSAQQDQNGLWRQIKQAIESASKIIFIGYSLPEYDDYAKKFFKATCASKEIEVWNPSPGDCMRFGATFGDSIHTHQAKFEESKYVE